MNAKPFDDMPASPKALEQEPTADIEPGRVGSSFDDFLAEQGILEEVHAQASKEVSAWQAGCRIGTIGEFRQWSHEVVRDPAAAENAPKRWFDNEGTARAGIVSAKTASSYDEKMADPEDR